MAFQTWGYGALQAAISLGTVFNSMGTTTPITSAAFTNPLLTPGATGSYPTYADLVLTFTSVTTGSTQPNFQAVIIPADDGTNYESAAVVNSQLYPVAGGAIAQLPAGTGITIIRVPFLTFWPATNLKLAAFNNSGVALPATVTANLYPYAGATG